MFKQYYTFFHTFFYLHVFSKNTNNVIITKRPDITVSLHQQVQEGPEVPWKFHSLLPDGEENDKRRESPLANFL